MAGPTVTNDDTGAVTPANAPLPLVNGGTGSDLSVTGGGHQVLQQASAGANVTVGQLATSDLSDVVAPASFTPVLGASAGTFSASVVAARKTRLGNKLMKLGITLSVGTVSVTPQYLTVTIPDGYVAAQAGIGVSVAISDNGTAGSGWAQTSGTTIQIYKNITGSVNWSGPNIYLGFEIIFSTTT